MDGDKFILLYVAFTFGQIVINLGLNGADQSVEEKCYKLNTCDYAKNIYVPNCYCDHLCHIYDDCCIDFTIPDEKNDKSEEIKELTERSREECLPVYGINVGVHVIQSCPKDNHSAIENIFPQNESGIIFDILPVTSLNNIVYRNMYIAQCNEDTDYKFWNLIFELSFCFSTEESDIVDVSELDVANKLLQIGCHYTLVPPAATSVPRFCIKFESSDRNENRTRLPVRAQTYVFRNKETCKGYHPLNSCSRCFESGFRTQFQFESRHGLSMNALFKISNDLNQVRFESKETSANEVVFRNLKPSRQLSASTLDKFDIKEWDRASFFYYECVMHALIDFDPTFGFFSRLYFSKELGSDNGHVIGNVDIFIGKELQSHTVLADNETWLDKHKIRYSEVSESGTITYEFTTPRLTKKSGFTVCSDDTDVCQYLGDIRKELVESDITRQIKQSKKFPSHNCLEIHGTVEIFKSRKSFNVLCLAPNILVQKPDKIQLVSVLRFVSLCVSSMLLCQKYL